MQYILIFQKKDFKYNKITKTVLTSYGITKVVGKIKILQITGLHLFEIFLSCSILPKPVYVHMGRGAFLFIYTIFQRSKRKLVRK